MSATPVWRRLRRRSQRMRRHVWKSWSKVATASCPTGSAARRGEARPAREVRPSRHPRRRRGRPRNATPPGRPSSSASSSHSQQGPGHPGRGRGRGQDGGPRQGAPTGCSARRARRRTGGASTAGRHPDLAGRRRWPRVDARRPRRANVADDERRDLERMVGPLTVLGDGPLVVREKITPARPR